MKIRFKVGFNLALKELMLLDHQGLPVTTDSPDAIAAIDQFAQQMLGYENNPQVILQGLAADPTSVLVNAHVAALHLFAETASASTAAKPYLYAAQQHLDLATEREQLYVEAIAAWSDYDFDRALACHTVLAECYPQDVLAAQIGQYHHFNLGNAQGLLKLAETILPANLENHFVYGMVAFGLEQCHRLTEAETAGRQAVEMNRQDPWAHHAVAHVMETQHRLDEGIAWMESLADTWENCGTFRTHNWWHVALYYLAQSNVEQVLHLYDSQIWGRAVKDYSQCLINAISLLVRLELRGIDVGDRWQELGDAVRDRHDHISPLLDTQYIYALTRAGYDQWVREMLDSIVAYSQQAHPSIRAIWAEVTVPVAQAMMAHARQDWSTCVKQLAIANPKLHQLGGSHAQRDIYHQIYHHAKTQQSLSSRFNL
ncbi:MAG: tetratricopeptide repeat protein [Oculatellaceae cyanobacterium bins.114]|nr:tetratricopeptide repeat protein [Oculatellaceae cyanobacterium bins.114]